MPDTIVIEAEAKEKKQILKAYKRLYKAIEPLMDEVDHVQLKDAFKLAVDAHKEQRRKSGEPYILHPIEVARICAEEIGLGPTAIIAALLHDTVEDTYVTLEMIEEKFSEKIAKIVDGLTKIEGTYMTDVPQVENFRKVLSTLLFDVRVVLIKMADRLHNMRTLKSMPKHKQLRIASETSFIYAPLAHRLGLYNLKSEFEDLSMKVVEAKEYQKLKHKLKETKSERNAYIEAFISPLRPKIQALGFDYRITGRPKSISSIYNKIVTKNVSFEEIYDLFAIRIILDVPPDLEKQVCWQVYSIVTDVHTPIPERLKDWVTTPKSNGYESLHTTVIGDDGRFVEVQIRTERMDEVAERGFAAHWKYKGQNKHNHFGPWLDNVRHILEDSDNDALEFISDFKSSLFKDEVFVYTPSGEMKVLPQGATALDFAFSIHTDIGYHCYAIKVNNKLVPMGYELMNGDQVTVTTKQSQKPNENWLKLVKSSKAKSRIRAALREEKKKIGEIGKETLMRKLGHMKVDVDHAIDIIVQQLDYKNHTDLYYDIATERLDISFLKDFVVENRKLVPKPKVLNEEEEAHRERSFAGKKGKKAEGKSYIIFNGEVGDDLQYSLATCCNPVQGDPIFGFITTDQGIKVHRSSCSNASYLLSQYGYRVLKAEWNDGNSTEFIAKIRIIGVDEGPGVIQRLTQEISSTLGLNIKSLSIEGNEGRFEGSVGITVQSTDQINSLIERIKQLEGISVVERTD